MTRRARDRGALRRRRRRAVRRLRALRGRAGRAALRRPARTAAEAPSAALLGLLPPAALRGRAPAARSASRGLPARGLPDAYRCWISFVPEEDRDALLDGNRDDWGLDDYRAIWRRLGGRAPARPAARPEPAHLPARRPAREGRPDEHGPRARGALAVPRRRADRLHRRGSRRGYKARGLSLKRVLKAAVADLLPPEILKPAEARLRRAARPLVPRGPARRTSARTLGAPDARVKQHLVPEARGPPARGARLGRAQPRPRALDAAHARGVPAARGLVSGSGWPAQPFSTSCSSTLRAGRATEPDWATLCADGQISGDRCRRLQHVWGPH